MQLNSYFYLSNCPHHQRWAPLFSIAFPILQFQQHQQVFPRAYWLEMDFHHVEATASQSAALNKLTLRLSTTCYLTSIKILCCTWNVSNTICDPKSCLWYWCWKERLQQLKCKVQVVHRVCYVKDVKGKARDSCPLLHSINIKKRKRGLCSCCSSISSHSLSGSPPTRLFTPLHLIHPLAPNFIPLQ